MKKNLIVLKNLKYHEDMSEETLCFTADVYIKGHKAGYAKNGGYGGMTEVRPYHEMGRKLINIVEEMIKDMPPEIFEHSTPSSPFKPTLDFFIDGIVSNMLDEKENKRISNWIKRKLPTGIIAKNGDEYHYFPFLSRNTPEGRKMIINVAKREYPNCEILNKF